jgi:hypothetical protein
MDAPDPPRPVAGEPRAQALALLDEFLARSLPGCLRRLNQWFGLSIRDHPDVVDDLRQELALDCLENAALIVTLGGRDRTIRWMRVLEAAHYELRVRAWRRAVDPAALHERQVPGPSPIELGFDAEQTRALRRVARRATHLVNGRICLRSTARETGIGRNRLRALWSDLAGALGLDHEYLEFWRRRLAEALCMVAAARLRAEGSLRLFDDDARRPFDPRAFLQRLGRIRDALLSRPIDRTVREAVLASLGTGVRLAELRPRQLLELAESIAARDPAILLWRFELEVADPDGDLGTAARCLFEARTVEPDRTRIRLARARLLEARGRLDACRALLARGVARSRGTDRRLLASLQALGGGAARRTASSARRAPRRPDAREGARLRSADAG